MPATAYSIRAPVVEDAASLGSVHVRAWDAAYRGLMPDDYLDSLSADDRAEMWRTSLAGERSSNRVRLVAEKGGLAVGFALLGPEAAEAEAVRGELYAINVDPDHWGRGAGSLLIDAGLDALGELGYREIVLWVHPGNTNARRFYEHRGWTHDGTDRVEEVLGVTTAEVRYVWNRPSEVG